MCKLRILVLHAMGPRNKWFPGVADVELMFARYDSSNRYIVHNAYIDLPKFIRTYPFDAVIMMSTFIDKVVGEGLSSRWIKKYQFLKLFAGSKLAFPQDDYWFSETRDQFYVEYSIDRVYPVCPQNSWPELIPNYLENGGDVKQGFTTYITPMMRGLELLNKPLSERENHIVYRANKAPKAPNHYGYIKGVIGQNFLSKVSGSKYSFDISSDSKALIHGDEWYKFIANSRAILGANSGSTVRLRNIQALLRLKEYQSQHPNKPGNEVADAVFATEDRGKNYSAISPRNIEAAMLGTLQILVEGPYSGLLEPKKDYLTLAEDCSNAEEILEIVSNDVALKDITDNCRNKLLKTKCLQVEHVISDVVNFIIINKIIGSDNKCDWVNFNICCQLHYFYSIVFINIKKYFFHFLFVLVPHMPLFLRNFLKMLRFKFFGQ